jgi:hypothetical protein
LFTGRVILMLDAMLSQLETDLRSALDSCVTGILATTRTQLEVALAEIDRERDKGLAVVAEQRAKAVAYVSTKRIELEREIEAMHVFREQQQGHIVLNVGGHRFETSVQTLRRVPGSLFDAYFSGRYAQDLCVDGSIFIDRDGELFGHVLDFMRDGVLSVAEQGRRQRVTLLRRLNREFRFFSIVPGPTDHFDSLLAAARCSDRGHPEHVKKEMQDMDRETMDDDEEEDTETDEDEESTNNASKDEVSSMTTSERALECNRLNKTRHQLEGDRATSKWCTLCFEDLALDMFHRKANSKMFGRMSQCKACRTKKRMMDDEEEDTETDDDEESTNNASKDEVSSMNTAKSARECKRLNKTRRQLEGDKATSKWCTVCFADLALDMFQRKANHKMFGRSSQCKSCCSKIAKRRRVMKSAKRSEVMTDREASEKEDVDQRKQR